MKYLIVGGAGFIGSHLVHRLLKTSDTTAVTVFDNFSSGRLSFLADVESDSRLKIATGDAQSIEALLPHCQGVDLMFHFASNPDIARAVTEPTIDFYSGTLLTQNVVEAARRASVPRVLYASGSGVYGEMGTEFYSESPITAQPVSTYGASKLAGETLLCAYSAMFGVACSAFRFANVVGPRQTHGVGYDFIRKLRHDPRKLVILGDGQQSKSYVHVDDVLSAMLLFAKLGRPGYEVHNVSTDDFLTVTEIAMIVVAEMGLSTSQVEFSYTGGSRGWKGDVPVVRISADKLKAQGWKARYTARGAMQDAVRAMVHDSSLPPI
jgi:UDP-glucose 4-epimerase